MDQIQIYNPINLYTASSMRCFVPIQSYISNSGARYAIHTRTNRFIATTVKMLDSRQNKNFVTSRFQFIASAFFKNALTNFLLLSFTVTKQELLRR